MLSYDEKKPLIAMVVPTGIGASIGGFAGDASLTAKMFARDFNVIVNPNVVNAACFSGISDNTETTILSSSDSAAGAPSQKKLPDFAKEIHPDILRLRA